MPLVEWTSTVTDQYAQTLIQKIEMVQRRAARYVKNRHRNASSVADMLCTMNWQSFQDRRKDARLCMLCKKNTIEMAAITKDKRLIQPQRRTRHSPDTELQDISKKELIHPKKKQKKKQFVTGMRFPQTSQKQSPWLHSKPR